VEVPPSQGIKDHILAHQALICEYAACEDVEQFKESQLVDHFVYSCEKSLRGRILAVPQGTWNTMKDVYVVATQQEALMRGLNPQQISKAPSGFPKLDNSQGPQPMDLSSLNQERRGPLTPAERKQRQDNQLCRYCGKHGEEMVCPINGKVNNGRGSGPPPDNTQQQRSSTPRKPQLRPFPQINNVSTPASTTAINPQTDHQLNDQESDANE